MVVGGEGVENIIVRKMKGMKSPRNVRRQAVSFLKENDGWFKGKKGFRECLVPMRVTLVEPTYVPGDGREGHYLGVTGVAPAAMA